MGDFTDQEREDFARQDGIQNLRQRRSPPRLPAGTLRLRGAGNGGCVPLAEASFLTEREKALFRIVNGEFLNVIRFGVDTGVPVPDDFRQALERVAHAIFDCEPNDALWLVPFLVELELGRSERLALETREANPSSTALLAIAEAVLKRARRTVQQLEASTVLPRWLTPRLTALLLKRFSFVGGGGAHAALTRTSIKRLLANPRSLTRYLRESSVRAAYFASELTLLDAEVARRGSKRSRANRTRPDLVDPEHASPSERRDVDEVIKATRASELARVASSRAVSCEGRFVAVRFERATQREPTGAMGGANRSVATNT